MEKTLMTQATSRLIRNWVDSQVRPFLPIVMNIVKCGLHTSAMNRMQTGCGG